MKVLILGAGVIGTTSAWYLARQGHEVTVVDRQSAAAMETSFANGGQISAGHAEPWANPSAPAKIFKWLLLEDAPLKFRWRADIEQWRWGLRFLLECNPTATARNTLILLTLALDSRARTKALRRELDLRYDLSEGGILHLYSNARDFEGAMAQAETMKKLGLERKVITPQEAVAIEPALAHMQSTLAGATFSADDEAGDAAQFTQQLAEKAAAQGVTFRYDTTVLGARAGDGGVKHVRVKDANGEHDLAADAYLVCLGSYSPLLLRPMGIASSIFPAKGYSATVSTAGRSGAPRISITDDSFKMAFSPLGDRLRVAGTAELAGYSRDLNDVRCAALVKRARELFPDAADYDAPTFWTGLRPATPSNVPYIGKTKFPNLFLNTGHGTLGWTLACGSAHAIAEIMSGRTPSLRFPFTS